MAHELSIRADGTAEMAFVGQVPWHGLGTELNQDSTIEEWVDAAGFNWDIVPTPVLYTDVDGTIHTNDDKRVLYRSDTKAPLSVVGSDYKIIQPKEVLEFFRDLVNGTGMYLETAGMLYGGKRFWALANTSKVDYVGMKEDIAKGYLLLATSCDGTFASIAQLNSVRVVCNNTMRIAMNEQTSSRVRVTHRSVFDADMVKRKLGLYDDAWNKYIEDCNKLASKKVTDNEAKAIIDKLILSKPDDPANASMQSKNQADFIMSLYKGAGMGANMTYGNAYGVLNAITETVDHHSRNRTADAKLWNQFFGSGEKLKTEAFDTLLELV